MRLTLPFQDAITRRSGLDLRAAVEETVEQVADNDIPGLSAEMAYHGTLTVFPFLLFLAGLTAVLETVFGLGDLPDRAVDRIGEVLSGDATGVIRSLVDEIRQSNGSGALLAGLLGTLWSGSAVIGSAIKGLNRIYDRKETRGMVPRKLLAVGLAIVFCGTIFLATVVVGAGGIIASALGDRLGWSTGVEALANVLIWPLAAVMVWLAAAVLYWLGPAGEKQFRWVTAGAAVFVLGWVIASALFAFYISNFSTYNTTYGSLGLVIILLAWLYWSSFLLLMGAQLNCVIEQIRDGVDGSISRRPKTSQAQP